MMVMRKGKQEQSEGKKRMDGRCECTGLCHRVLHKTISFMWALSEEKNMKNKQLKYIVNCQAQLPPD